ncbi:Crp/Fnr family transcriptional regulator [Pacificimonas flava]|uniref:Crp/Fnr family transcriptional regulator n=2 Tax=Pacificimonas TaxID=1960290 RepID=A0A219B152_9SPHN|nr:MULTISPECIES: Crp/Fnr family transcriptional regulator [Pacificimonas]MBZ6378306.1 Crp/Fnr family transcriptional regulator [Pacificimonas aurantium]OWV32082.1 Crp/Fnr family transcriptional regulator [Pacificimonas flava]
MTALPRSCEMCVVRNRAVCSVLDGEELSVLNRIGRRQTLAPGQSLYWEGDDALLVGNVLEGVLKLTTSLSDGREQTVGLVYPSDFIGRPFGNTAGHSVTALTEARICTFAQSDFERFAEDHPKLEHKLYEKTLTELDRAREWMLLLARKSASERIATFLLEMSDRLRASGCAPLPGTLDRFELPFGRQQIGDVLGLTIETVSRRLTALKREGIIDLEGRRGIVIVDRAALEDQAQAGE